MSKPDPKDLCKRGHDLREHGILRANGKRQCRLCHNERRRKDGGVANMAPAHYDDPNNERVILGLTMLARHGGNASAASRECDIKSSTLSSWKKKHSDKYLEIQEEELPKIRAHAAELALASVERAHEIEMKALEKIDKALDAGEFDARDLANLSRSVSTTKGINYTHADKFHAEPKKNEEPKGWDEMQAALGFLARSGVLKVPNETPVLDAEVVDEPPPTPDD